MSGAGKKYTWANRLVVFAYQCTSTGIRFLLAVNTTLILYILQFMTCFACHCWSSSRQ